MKFLCVDPDKRGEIWRLVKDLNHTLECGYRKKNPQNFQQSVFKQDLGYVGKSSILVK